MIGPPTNTRVWIAAAVMDLRRGFTGLSALVESKLEQKLVGVATHLRAIPRATASR